CVSVSAATSARTMDQSLARSLAWRAAGDWFSQIFSWASLLIIVRLLSPADFGIVAMAVVLLPYLRYLGQFGIPRTIITLRDLTDDQLAQLNTVASVLGFACFALAGLLAKPFALLFRTPRLTPVVLVTCIGLIPLRFGWHVVVSLVALNSYQGLDNAISGRVLGQAALGAYGIACTLANVPLEKVTSLVTTVVPTYLAAVQKDATQLRRYIRTLTE